LCARAGNPHPARATDTMFCQASAFIDQFGCAPCIRPTLLGISSLPHDTFWDLHFTTWYFWGFLFYYPALWGFLLDRPLDEKRSLSNVSTVVENKTFVAGVTKIFSTLQIKLLL